MSLNNIDKSLLTGFVKALSVMPEDQRAEVLSGLKNLDYEAIAAAKDEAGLESLVSKVTLRKSSGGGVLPMGSKGIW